jgi:hypothetical protein
MQVWHYFQSFIKTSTGGRALEQLFDAIAEINMETISTQLVGGTYRTVSDKRLLMPYDDGNLIKDIISETLRVITTRISNPMTRIFTIEILNGTTRPGLAASTAETLRGFGYDVVNIDNAEAADREKTLLIDRSGFPEFATALGNIIRCGNIEGQSGADRANAQSYGLSEQDLAIKADFTLILGRDFNGRYVTGQ